MVTTLQHFKLDYKIYDEEPIWLLHIWLFLTVSWLSYMLS